MNELGYMEREIKRMQARNIDDYEPANDIVESELFLYLVIDTEAVLWTFSAEDIEHAIEQYKDGIGNPPDAGSGIVKAVFKLAGDSIENEEFYVSNS